MPAAVTFQPPPTYAEVILSRETGKVDTEGEAILEYYFNPIWLEWFVKLAAFLSANSGGGGGAAHNLLSGLQGGSANQYYHLTAAQTTALTAGFTGTGNIVRATSPTLVTPALGKPASGDLANTSNLPVTGIAGVTGNTGTGNLVLQTGPTFITPVLGNASATNMTLGNASALVRTSVALNNGSGVGLGTLTNAPTAGDPSKWVSIDDNGTIRKVPTWT